MNASGTPSPDDTPLHDRDVLLEPFRTSEQPRSAWRIGGEAEKFGVFVPGLAPLPYDGDDGVVGLFDHLVRRHGWAAQRERPDGPVVALQRAGASVTLEPGAQVELSGAPMSAVHEICAEMREHLGELSGFAESRSVAWLGVGFHPFASQDALPWVPKLRYRIMREYLPTRGRGAHDMMRRTATVQANYDYESEEDALRKLRVALKLSPLVHAMTANAPFREGKLAGAKSVRGEVWRHMDPSRSGLIPTLWQNERAGYRDYVEWALDAGMFLFKRDGNVVENTGQTFRSFMTEGFGAHRATLGDWKLHLTTLFPEARLKKTLEVRSCDSLPVDLACAPAALFAGILYDERALAAAEHLVRDFRFDVIEAERAALVSRGLSATVGGAPAREVALELLDVATGGLQRRGRTNSAGRDESLHLERLRELTLAGKSPADVLTEGLSNDQPDLRQRILERTRL